MLSGRLRHMRSVFDGIGAEAIARRNAAAIEPDRIQTRCRGDGARTQVFATIEQVSRTAGLVGPASDFLSAL